MHFVQISQYTNRGTHAFAYVRLNCCRFLLLLLLCFVFFSSFLFNALQTHIDYRLYYEFMYTRARVCLCLCVSVSVLHLVYYDELVVLAFFSLYLDAFEALIDNNEKRKKNVLRKLYSKNSRLSLSVLCYNVCFLALSLRIAKCIQMFKSRLIS